MSDCPRCHHSVDSQAIACPRCGFELKAFGHPGIPLYQAQDDTYLCQTCIYDADDSCNFPQRPHAKTCTLYRDHHPIAAEPRGRQSWHEGRWLERNLIWIVLISLAFVAVILAL